MLRRIGVLAKELHVRDAGSRVICGGAIEIFASIRQRINTPVHYIVQHRSAHQTLPAIDIANYIEPGTRSVLLMMYHA
jgi:hypothetical protein